MAAECYYATRRLAAGLLTDIGVQVHLVSDDEVSRHLDGATLVWLESPSNPKLDVCDIAAICAAAHHAGAAVAVDNTTATPLGQQPLALGADYSVASDTKALTGHSDLVLGHVACADADRAAAVRTWRSSTGSVPGVFEAWLAHRSLMTLDLRLARQATNALALAELVVFLSLAPKSNAIYVAYGQAQGDVTNTRNDPVPIHLRNAPTKMMKDLGYGKGYRYAHDFEEGVVGQQNLPEALAGRRYYAPTDRGFEAELAARLERIREIYARTTGDPKSDVKENR
jgi:O-acetylhomoserine/O-acetylserine sulfhydrylase-like pyridoxal-dependent enzyme